LVTERPVIATMASVDFGVIPRSKIKAYAEDDLGLIGEEVDLFISVIRRVETKSRSKVVADPEMTDQASDPDGVKKILGRNAKPDKSLHSKKPKVRHPR
jgi:hypothetical protein